MGDSLDTIIVGWYFVRDFSRKDLREAISLNLRYMPSTR